jgi:glycosyltransferase involved in cell wall biosynthesis
MKVSIITTTLNSEKTIESTILSIINQTYKNIEYIIIDGCSSDSTLSIISKYIDHLSYFKSARDENLYDGMNKGIDVSSGDIIGIVNSDDFLEEDAVEKIVNFFFRHNCDAVHGNLRVIKDFDEKSEILRPRNYFFAKYISLPIYHPTLFVKREIYRSIGSYNISYPHLADYDFYLRLINNKNNILYLNELISNMRSGGISDRVDNFSNLISESNKIKKRNDLNYFLSAIGQIIHISRFKIYRTMKFFNLNFLIKIYRKLKY